MKLLVKWLRSALTPPQPYFNVADWRIRKLLQETSPGARVLEVGSGGRRLAPHVINLDLQPFPNVDVVADAQFLPFKAASFDLVFAVALLEHVPSPEAVLDQIERALRPGGILYADVPFLLSFHLVPFDFCRFTSMGMGSLFRGFQRLESGVAVGPSSTLAQVLREYFSLFDNKLLHRFFLFLTGWLFFPLKYLDRWAATKNCAHTLATAFFFVGKKAGTSFAQAVPPKSWD